MRNLPFVEVQAKVVDTDLYRLFTLHFNDVGLLLLSGVTILLMVMRMVMIMMMIMTMIILLI